MHREIWGHDRGHTETHTHTHTNKMLRAGVQLVGHTSIIIIIITGSRCCTDSYLIVLSHTFLRLLNNIRTHLTENISHVDVLGEIKST